MLPILRASALVRSAATWRRIRVVRTHWRAGVNDDHVLGLEFVMPDGTIHTTGGKELDQPGYDLTGLLTGSEGTMALVTKIIVRLMRHPEKVKTILAVYNSASDAADTVAEITPAITPVAVEMLDGEMLRMVEVATHAGYPMDAAAVLLIELEGLVEAVEEQTEQIRQVCERCGAREFRVAKSAEERELLWKEEERFRRGGARQFVLLRAGWRGAAYSGGADAALYRGKWPNITCKSVIFFMRATATCIRLFCFNARAAGELDRASGGGRGDFNHCISGGRVHHRGTWRWDGEATS